MIKASMEKSVFVNDVILLYELRQYKNNVNVAKCTFYVDREVYTQLCLISRKWRSVYANPIRQKCFQEKFTQKDEEQFYL